MIVRLRATTFGWSLVVSWEDEDMGMPVSVDCRLADRYVVTKITVRADSDQMAQAGKDLGLSDAAVAFFRHACTEVELTVRVHRATGAVEIIGVDGRSLR